MVIRWAGPIHMTVKRLVTAFIRHFGQGGLGGEGGGLTSLSLTLNEVLHTHVAVSIEDLASFLGPLSLSLSPLVEHTW